MKKKSTYEITKSAVKIPLPNTYQKEDYTCGGIAMKSILRYYGIANFTEKGMEKELNMSKEGTDPWQFINILKKYGLKFREYNSMTRQQLIYFMQKHKPVIVTIQAWAKKIPKTYKDNWKEGHWIIAIGYDKKGFYFEDPSLKDTRGFISYEEFEDRWHDTGDNDFPEDHYGLVIWGKKAVHKNLKATRVSYIQ